MLLEISIYVHGVHGGFFSGQFFYVILKVHVCFFCFVVAIFDLVHDVEALFQSLNVKITDLEIFSEI